MKSNLIVFSLFVFLVGIFISCSPETTTEVNTIESHEEYSNVEAAILDYVEGVYGVDSTRIERSVHPELRKRGYWYSEEEQKYYDNLNMTYEQLVTLAATWNAKGDQADENSPKQIEIYDINDRTASAKLTAVWGIDYFHLAKLDGKWYIMNVLWQSIQE